MPGSIIVPNPAVHSTNEKKKKEKYRQPNEAHQKTLKKKNYIHSSVWNIH